MGSYDAMIERFLAAHPRDAARVLEAHAPVDAARLLPAVPLDAAVGVLASLVPEHAAPMLAALDDDVAARLLERLPLDVAGQLLRRLDDEPRARMLGLATPADARRLDAQLRYPEGVAGALMDPRVPALPHDIDVRGARERVERNKNRGLYYQYVVGPRQKLVGVITLRDLLLAPVEARLADVMRTELVTLDVDDDPPAILAHPGWRTLHALPVVDASFALVGAVRYGMLRELERRQRITHRQAPMADGLELSELVWDVTANLLDVVLGRGRNERR